MKQIFLLIAFLAYLNNTEAQITYDFNSKELKTGKINDTDDIIIKLNNFNPFLYKYSISTKIETFNSEIPKLLKNADGSIFTIQDFLSILNTKTNSEDSRRTAEDAKSNVLKAIFKIDTCFLKFYAPNYKFDISHKIPEEHLKKLTSEISQLVVSDPNSSDIENYIKKLISYKKINAFFNKELFNKTIKLSKLNADILKITFLLEPLETEMPIFNATLSKDSINVEIPIQRRKGYITYSTGLFISGIGNPTYAIQNKKIIKEEGSGNAFGFNAIAHYMWDVQKVQPWVFTWA